MDIYHYHIIILCHNITLKPLAGEVNNIGYLVTLAPVMGWGILYQAAREPHFSKLTCWRKEK